GGKCMACAHRPAKKIQSFGKALFKLPDAPAPLPEHEHERNYGDDSSGEKLHQRMRIEPSCDQIRAKRQHSVDQYELRRLELYSRLHESFPQLSGPRPAHHHAVKRRHAAHHLVLHQLQRERHFAALFRFLDGLHPAAYNFLILVRAYRKPDEHQKERYEQKCENGDQQRHRAPPSLNSEDPRFFIVILVTLLLVIRSVRPQTSKSALVLRRPPAAR